MVKERKNKDYLEKKQVETLIRELNWFEKKCLYLEKVADRCMENEVNLANSVDWAAILDMMIALLTPNY